VHGVSIDDMLEMYALFKQAKFGDNTTCEFAGFCSAPPQWKWSSQEACEGKAAGTQQTRTKMSTG
jgi:acyl-CoA-binding protein